MRAQKGRGVKGFLCRACAGALESLQAARNGSQLQCSVGLWMANYCISVLRLG